MTKRTRKARQDRLRQEQAAPHVPGRRTRRGLRVCPTCGTHLAVDDRSRTERALSNVDHDLVAYFRFHDRIGTNSGTPGESEQFMARLDGGRTRRVERRHLAITTVCAFVHEFPEHAGYIVSVFGRLEDARTVVSRLYGAAAVSERRMEDIAVIVERGRTLLIERLEAVGFYAPAA